jgi:hypothetical protein
MPEGLLGGIAGAKAFAAAAAVIASRRNPEAVRKTAALPDHQSLLLETRREHLRDAHELRLAHLRKPLREEAIRGFGLRLRVGCRRFPVLVATVIGVGGALTIRDAVAPRRIRRSPARVRAHFRHRHVRYAA